MCEIEFEHSKNGRPKEQTTREAAGLGMPNLFRELGHYESLPIPTHMQPLVLQELSDQRYRA